MINKFTYKERDYVEELLNNGFMTKYTYYEMSLLCKYWARTMNLPKDEVKQNLIYFCETNMQNFHYALEYKTIRRAVNSAFGKMSDLIQIDYVPIYEHEIAFIKDSGLAQNFQRLLFAFLVLKRIHSYIWKINSGTDKMGCYLKGSQKQTRLLKEMAHLAGGKKDDIDYMIHDLGELGYLTVLPLGENYLNFIDTLKEDNSPEAVRVSDFEHVWMYYDCLVNYTRAGRIIICKECGAPVSVKTFAPQKYCTECARKIKNRQNRAHRMRKCMEKE